MSEPVFIVTLTEAQCDALSSAALCVAESFAAMHEKPSPEDQQALCALFEANLAIVEGMQS